MKLDNIAALAAERAGGCRDHALVGVFAGGPLTGLLGASVCGSAPAFFPRAEGRVGVWTEERRPRNEGGATREDIDCARPGGERDS